MSKKRNRKPQHLHPEQLEELKHLLIDLRYWMSQAQSLTNLMKRTESQIRYIVEQETDNG